MNIAKRLSATAQGFPQFLTPVDGAYCPDSDISVGIWTVARPQSHVATNYKRKNAGSKSVTQRIH
jgi:hypothetical protein